MITIANCPETSEPSYRNGWMGRCPRFEFLGNSNSIRYTSRYTALGIAKRNERRDDTYLVFGRDPCQTTLGRFQSFYRRFTADPKATQRMRDEDPSSENINITLTPNVPLAKEMAEDKLVLVVIPSSSLLNPFRPAQTHVHGHRLETGRPGVRLSSSNRRLDFRVLQFRHKLGHETHFHSLLPRRHGQVPSLRDEVRAQELELPRINPGYERKAYRYAYGLGNYENSGNSAMGLSASVPVFIPNPEGVGEDDGVLLYVVNDKESNDGMRTFVLVLDARTFGELARAEVGDFKAVVLHRSFVDGI
ncbi:hypothetical protein BC938DRAFT_474364, partial [Jimgerdemannia flammicorona]